MTAPEIIALMATATLPSEWNTLARGVKAAHGGEYPDAWQDLVIDSGLYDRVAARWGDTGPATQARTLKAGE